MITLENASEVLKKIYTPALSKVLNQTFADMAIEREFRIKKQTWADEVIESRLSRVERFILKKVRHRYRLRFIRDFILKDFRIEEVDEKGLDRIKAYRKNIQIGEKEFKYILINEFTKKGVAE